MTDTTPPPPQVVAWMRNYRRGTPAATLVELVRAYRDTHSPDGTTGALLWTTGIGLTAMRDAAYVALTTPTLADIPAGQGPASLFLMPQDGHGAVWFKAAGKALVHIMWDPADSVTVPHLRAVWEHLAATLPHVTDEEEA